MISILQNIRRGYMQYPNASKGLQRMVMAEIIALAASILAVVVSVFALPVFDIGELNNYSFSVIDIIILIVILLLYIAAYIMELFGIMLASKDEPAFKVSLYAIIAAIALTILAGIFYENETISDIISIGGDVAQFFLVHYIIHGIMHLSDHLGKHKTSKMGTYIFRVIYIAIAFEVIVRIIEIIFGEERGEAIAMPFDVIANIMKSAEYILFLIYILKANKMLKESKAESSKTE